MHKFSAYIILAFTFISCSNDDSSTPNLKDTSETEWVRDINNPILRDLIPNQNYEVASDGHVFYDEEGDLRMIYAGDKDDKIAIKLANGSSLTQWSPKTTLIFEANNNGLDVYKETPFYRKSNTGKHQIFYIGYDDESTYKSQIYLAESDELEGNYNSLSTPIVPRGQIAGKDVYLITSPSVIEHEGLLHIIFLGWNNSPQKVTEVWMIGATSSDNGYTWSNFQIVDTPIGMEGQVTKKPNGDYVAVRTGEFKGDEALFYATSDHPFGPWNTSETPFLTKDGSNLEKDEIIAPQITFDPQTGEEFLFYTGADYQTGWWMMLARSK